MSRRRKKKKNPYLGDEPLREDLVAQEEVTFRENMLGEYGEDDPLDHEKETEAPPEPPPPPRGPLDEMGLSPEDRKIIPPEMLLTVEVEEDEGKHFTLFVSEVTTSMKKLGNFRLPVLRFKVQLSLVRYYMVEATPGGSMRPAIEHAPISEPFEMDLPVTFLPKAVQKFPDMVSPALATKILTQMMDRYPWSTIKPAPKPDIEHLIPEDIIKKIKSNPPRP